MFSQPESKSLSCQITVTVHMVMRAVNQIKLKTSSGSNRNNTTTFCSGVLTHIPSLSLKIEVLLFESFWLL